MSDMQLPSPSALLALIKSRRSIRHFLPDPVPEEMLDQMIEAGRWAPSAGNRQPWVFIVIQDDELRTQVAQHAAYYYDREARIEEAPLLIALCARSSRSSQRMRGDVAMAGMQMMLQAHALGLGTCWVDGLDREAIAQILGVRENTAIVALLTVGFPAETPPPPPRKPVDEIAHYDLCESVFLR